MHRTLRIAGATLLAATLAACSPSNDTAPASRAPAWSPAGQHIAFESDRSGNWDVFVMQYDGSHVDTLTTDPAEDRQPAWSPDGSSIVFVSDRSGSPDLYTVDIGTRQATRVAEIEGAEGFPAWSPDGEWIAFTRELDGEFDVLRVRVSDGYTEELLAGETRDVWSRWSPDGSQLLFFSRRDDHEDDEVYVLDMQTRDATRVTHREGHDFCPAWSPDGAHVVMVSVEADGSRSLVFRDLQGTQLAQLAGEFHRLSEPDWSPDGRWVAFSARRDEASPYQVYIQAVPELRPSE